MAKEEKKKKNESDTVEKMPIHVASSPHLNNSAFSTRTMMRDVILALMPAILVAVVIFRHHAVLVIGVCVASCMVSEVLFAKMRGKPSTLNDFSAVVTGLILGLSLPWSAPWYVPVIGGVIAIGIGKAVFGGLGYNLFNPAMVGRAFVMLSFAKVMGASAYVVEKSDLVVVTQATPLALAKKIAQEMMAGTITPDQAKTHLVSVVGLTQLFIGNVNGSLGEVSAVALIFGGLYLIVRRAASWEIPAGVIVSTLVFAMIAYFLGLTPFTGIHHIASGAILFGAFFIATDPVSSPITLKGKFFFGVGIGTLVMVLRIFSGYPEGVMFAVLVMNAMVPLLNRWTIPSPLGGIPEKKD
jgi:H+/Na+-translocating ferredoxin:NAD+ oxidoreductase subunit D